MSSRFVRPSVLLLGAALALSTATACVSRNVETISEEEAAELGSPPEALDPAAALAEAAELPSIAGTLRVASEVGTPPPGVLFVIVRVAGREGGPPLAVRQFTAELPTDFRISEADAMIPGTPFVGDLDVIARLDQDGNAFSRQPGDLEGRVGPVQAGASVEIVLGPDPGAEAEDP